MRCERLKVKLFISSIKLEGRKKLNLRKNTPWYIQKHIKKRRKADSIKEENAE